MTGHIGAPGSIARTKQAEGRSTYTVKELWQLACAYDQVPADSKFVVFSDSNPWAKKYNFAISALFATRGDFGWLTE